MHLSQALRLKPGATVVYKPTGTRLTVVEVWRERSGDRPGGRYPLVVTEEMGAITYFALRFPIPR